MRKVLHFTWKPILVIIPFILGMIGFITAGMPILQSIYHCICLYGMGYQTLPENTWIEIARWLAPVATAGSLILIVKALKHHIHAFFALCSGKSVAVYGNTEEKEILLKQLGMRGISMDDNYVKAHSYILLGSEEDNLSIYSKYADKLKDQHVYIMCSGLSSQASDLANLHLFSPEETAARFFWKEHCPYEISVKNQHKLNIVIIGFEKLGKELLLCGLKNNIFDPEQELEYHVFGKDNGFTKVYHQLVHISDKLVFHEEAWTESISSICRADMVIVCQQENQLTLLNDISFVLPEKNIYVFASNTTGAGFLSKHSNLTVYDWKTETLKLEHIVEDKLNLYAKRINLRYANLYNDVEINDHNLAIEWEKLNTFSRYSNISSADYHDVRRRMINEDKLTDVKLEYLSELEHIRWCRYHYLNNWSFGIPGNRKTKDPQKRIHTLLVPYSELSEEDKEKDRENIRMMLQMDKEGFKA